MIPLRWNKDSEILAVSLSTESLQMFESPQLWTVVFLIIYLTDLCVCVCVCVCGVCVRFAVICFSQNSQDIFHKNKIFISEALILYLLSI